MTVLNIGGPRFSILGGEGGNKGGPNFLLAVNLPEPRHQSVTNNYISHIANW